MSNRRVGESFERNLAKLLSEKGFWVHRVKQNEDGQPFDIIAARNGNTYVIDCKVCSHNYFRLNRIEENQYTAMTLWEECGNGDGWFALLINGSEIYMFSLKQLDEMSYQKGILNARDIVERGIPFEEWERRV